MAKKTAPEPQPAPTSLATVQQPAEDNSQMVSSTAAEAFLSAVKGPRPSVAKLPIITIAHKEARFLLPSGELVEEVSGYPIYWFQTRAFYKSPPRPGEGGKPPDCWSPDMIKPSMSSFDRQAETCAECIKNQWGTARDGRGKACSTKTWLFLLNGAFGKPPIGVLIFPPSSIKVLLGGKFTGGYLSQCQTKAHGVFEIVWSTFALKSLGDTVPYCTLEPRMGEVCTDIEKVERIAKVRNEFIAVMEELRGMTPIVKTED